MRWGVPVSGWSMTSDVGAVGVGERFRSVMTVSGVASGDDLAVGEQVDGVAEQGGQVEVVQGGEDRDVKPGHEFEDLDLIADIEMVGGFVENEVVGALGEGAGDEHPLLLAPGEGIEAAGGKMFAADPFDGLAGGRPVGVGVALEALLMRACGRS